MKAFCPICSKRVDLQFAEVIQETYGMPILDYDAAQERIQIDKTCPKPWQNVKTISTFLACAECSTRLIETDCLEVD